MARYEERRACHVSITLDSESTPIQHLKSTIDFATQDDFTMKLTSLLSLLTKKRSAKANDRALSRRRRFIIEALEERRVLAGGPFVQSISEAEYLVNTASVATVTFSEPVTGVDPSDFRLTTSKHLDFPSTVNVGAIQVTQVSTSIYQVVVNVINGDGELLRARL